MASRAAYLEELYARLTLEEEGVEGIVIERTKVNQINDK